MALVNTLLEGLEEVRDPLTFWAFLSVVALVGLYAFLRSSRFHKLWSRTLGSTLSSHQVFHLATYFLVGVFAILVLLVITAATAPLILQKQKVEERKIEASFLSIDETAEARKLFYRALRIFEEDKDYAQTLDMFREVSDAVQTDFSRDVVNGYITASYYGEGSHREGLNHICRLYDEREKDSVRYRFDIHAHIRRIALTEGYDIAEELAIEYLTKCGRRDFSPVWAGIPLAKMEYLKEGRTVYEENFRLSHEDSSYLKNVIKYYPYDAFLDHAHYFLHQFNKVVGTDSIIEDVAMIALLQQKTSGARFRTNGGRMNGEHVGGYIVPPEFWYLFENYRERFEESGRYEEIKKTYIRSMLEAGVFPEALVLATEERDGVKEYWQEIIHGFSKSVERIGLRETLALSKKYDFQRMLLLGKSEGWVESDDEWSYSQWDEYDGYVWDFLESMEMRTALENFAELSLVGSVRPNISSIWSRYFDIRGIRKLAEKNSVSALEEYHAQRDVLGTFDLPVPELLIKRIRRLEEMIHVSDKDAEQADLDVGIYLRDVGERRLAAKKFGALGNESSNPIVAQKALYLAGATLRRVKEYKAARDTFGTLFRRYPDGFLSDDALAEVGWYYLVVVEDHEEAYKYFEMVLDLFPDRNAADNALNWMATSKRRRRDYSGALKDYVALASNYAGSRLGRAAQGAIERMKALVESAETVTRLSDVGFRENRVIEVDGSESPLLIGDRIVRVDDYSVSDKDSLDAALATVAENHADVEILRGFAEERLIFRIPVEKVAVYDF